MPIVVAFPAIALRNFATELGGLCVIEFFSRLKNSKWVQWVGAAPFLIFLLPVVFDGEMLRGLGILAFFGSMLVGIILGAFSARILNTHFLKCSEDFGKRISAAFSGFGFLFLPSVVGNWTNAYLSTDTDIGMHSLGVDFMWACVVGGIFFCVGPSESKK
ncbi:MAG: hypothetical protein JKY94_15120 [Rhodobacteraceae bacterium]|nr:hypothetical protein [Paracoccaceae bacterium]